MLHQFLDKMKEKNIFTDKLEDGAPVFPYTLQREDSKVLLVCGQNATGKSLFSRYLSQSSRAANIQHAEISMGERAKKGYMKQAIAFGKYGDEDQESTGLLTIHRLTKEFNRRKDLEEPWFAVLDEPDIGLSDGYARAMGEYIAQQANAHEQNDFFNGMVIISHNRIMMDSLITHLKSTPNKMRVGDDGSFDSWRLGGEKHISVDDLLNLKTKTLETRKKFSRYIKMRG